MLWLCYSRNLATDDVAKIQQFHLVVDQYLAGLNAFNASRCRNVPYRTLQTISFPEITYIRSLVPVRNDDFLLQYYL